jgi:molybdopterin-guanine dinucleotide biosynthesis protein A
MKIAAVILAGGEGSRMGGDKPLRLLGGATLLDRVLRYASLLSGPMAVAIRDPNQIRDIGTRVILDDPSIGGPLAGLKAAMRFGRDERVDAVLTLPTDMPFLPSDLVDRLVNALPINMAAIASSGARLHPVCGLWRVQALDLIPEYLASERRSLRGFANSIGCCAVEWPVESVDPFFNINDLEDLATAERVLSY